MGAPRCRRGEKMETRAHSGNTHSAKKRAPLVPSGSSLRGEKKERLPANEYGGASESDERLSPEKICLCLRKGEGLSSRRKRERSRLLQGQRSLRGNGEFNKKGRRRRRRGKRRR